MFYWAKLLLWKGEIGQRHMTKKICLQQWKLHLQIHSAFVILSLEVLQCICARLICLGF